MFHDYRERGVEFYYVYKTVAHPEINNYVAPYTLAERLQHIAEAKKLTQSQIPWICDNMDNDLKTAFGGAPNSEFVIGPDGIIVRKRFWSDPAILRADLETLVGPVEHPTQVRDLDIDFHVEPRMRATGVVPRVTMPGRMQPLKIEPLLDDEFPSYVKLRAEASSDLLESGDGVLYLGFFVDPIYRVHWNNRAEPLVWELSAPVVGELDALQGQAPAIEVESDIDPREFLLLATGMTDKQPLEITVSYTACDDDETFCLPVTQRYRIHWERDEHGGSRPGVFMPELFANMQSMDANNDGQLSTDELPEGKVTMYLGHVDWNADGVISADEIDKFYRMFNNGAGFASDKNDGE